MNKNRRVMFLRDESYNPVGCLVISVSKKTNKIRYQYSVRNPIDRFKRDLARQIALGRLVEKPLSAGLALSNDNWTDITSVVMEQLVANESTPTRAVKSAKLWLNHHEDLED